MEKEEAIEHLTAMKELTPFDRPLTIASLSMAIEALEQREKPKEVRSEIIDDIEQIQLSIDSIGFKGQNEYDLHIRENIADYILLQFKSPYPKMNQPTIEDIQNTLYNCAKITQSDDGITMERLFKKEAEAILELFKSKDI